jgi:hypothetical protein
MKSKQITILFSNMALLVRMIQPQVDQSRKVLRMINQVRQTGKSFSTRQW